MNICYVSTYNLENVKDSSGVDELTILQNLSKDKEIFVVDSNKYYKIYHNKKVVGKFNYPFFVNKINNIINKIAKIFLVNIFQFRPRNEIGYLMGFFDINLILKVLHVSKKNNINIIQSFNLRSLPASALCSSLNNISLVSIQHNLASLTLGNFYGNTNIIRYIKKLEKFLYNFVDKIVVLSEKDKTRFNDFGLDGNIIEIVPLSVIKYDYDAKFVKDFRTKKNLKEKIIIFMHADWNYYPSKKMLRNFFFKVYIPLNLKYDNIVFVIAGRNNIELNIKNVIFVGWIEKLNQILSVADIAIVPEVVDKGGIQRKILDYFSAGKAVVSTKKGCSGLTIEHNFHSLVSDNLDSNFLDMVEILINNNHERLRLSKNSNLFWKENHSSESNTEKLNTIYSSLLIK